jgi:hypothetical protein
MPAISVDELEDLSFLIGQSHGRDPKRRSAPKGATSLDTFRAIPLAEVE